jgi:ADP-ribosylglycohydrolase
MSTSIQNLEDNAERLDRARISLEGLSVGDSFGDLWFFIGRDVTPFEPIEYRKLPAGQWEFTDDTQMALSVFSILRQYGEIDQEQLALSYANRYDRSRGYGPAMHSLLAQIRSGMPWQQAAKSLFSDQGSYGNGAAMRVAPVGAYFADNLEKAAEHAHRSAELTHAHPEASAGAIAVAVAAALAWQLCANSKVPTRQEFIDRVLPLIPDSEVRSKTRLARDMAPGNSVRNAVIMLGNGSGISAQDTVPFTLWCAGEHLDNYEEALWLTAAGGGDVDTNCAIVGGIVAMYTGRAGIPVKWLANREALPDWPFTEQKDD